MTADSGSGTPMAERMQALLSRAVEDQLTEQRQVAGLVGDVRNQLATLAAQMDELRASPPGATDHLEHAVAGVAGDVREAIRVLGERIDGVSGLVQQRGQDLAELRNAIEADMRPRVDSLDATMREMRGAFTGIAARVADLPGRADVEAIVGRQAESTAGVPERIDRLEGALDELHEGLLGEDGLHARIASMSPPSVDPDEVAAAAARAVQQSVDGVQHGLASVEQTIARVEHSIGGVPQQVDQAVAGIPETVEKAVAGIPEAVDRAVAGIPEAVERAVARAVADSEQRLSEHIDEAVLALAEALLRRRSSRPPASPFDTAEIQAITADFTLATATRSEPPAPVAEPPAPVAAPPEPVEPVAPAPAPFPPAPEPQPQPEFPPAAPMAEEEPPEVDLNARLQHASVAAATADAGDAALDDDEEGRKRRPWWRPGD